MDKTNIESVTHPVEETLETTRLGISGMTCDKCVETIEKAFRGKQGVKEVQVDRPGSMATLVYDPRQTNIAELHEVLLRSGYHPVSTAD